MNAPKSEPGFFADIRAAFPQPSAATGTPPPAPPVLAGVDGAHPYALAALRSQCEELAAAQPGNRNHLLNISAGKMAGYVAAGNLPADQTQRALLDAARTAGLPDSEILRTIRSGWDHGIQHPKPVPDTDKASDDWLASVAPATPAGRPAGPTRSEADSTLTAAFVDGGSFVFDIPDITPSVWGAGSEVLWAEGEALMIVGPSGVGKTTLTGQLVRALLGLQNDVLGYPVNNYGKVLYLAMDRPQQIRRSLNRHFQPNERDTVARGLIPRPGPPSADLAQHPDLLRSLAEAAGAGVVIVDSLKDAAIGLADDATAAGYNRARQKCLAAGIQVLELHHQTKRGAGDKQPTTLADVYGSTWITSGAGSVILLWGEAGSTVVRFMHLKQPAETVGPFDVSHDHDAGKSTKVDKADPLAMAQALAASGGMTARTFAMALHDTDKLTAAQLQGARHRLNRLVNEGRLSARDLPALNGANPGKVYLPARPAAPPTLPGLP
ncbi:AAA family ATPase [Arthrobacter sp. KBS0703]|uniref:AAA family ATPase n=1 Tax=Arthrobacter sp. KBS0703 TaxID=1955698 RepID=UPI00098F85B3|nr:AAA family ATPase [Arthrobacter sp. KBS0703]TSE15239.1 AAA family ATPase [Arthrobacter sp. KBS0703]